MFKIRELCIAISVVFSLEYINCIHTPGETTTASPFKSIWRKIAIQPIHHNVLMHHNYSKVHFHSKTPQYSSTGTSEQKPISNTEERQFISHPNGREPKNEWSEQTVSNNYQEKVETGHLGTQPVYSSPNYKSRDSQVFNTGTGQQGEERTINNYEQHIDSKLGSFNSKTGNTRQKDITLTINRPHSGFVEQSQHFNPNKNYEINEPVIQDKLAPLNPNIQIQDKLEFTNQYGQDFEATKPYKIDPGKSHLPPVTEELELFGFHWPPRPEEVHPFKARPYSNMAFEQCPKNYTGQVVYLWSCSQFLNCWKGRGFIQNCAPGTLFNPNTLECDFPYKVQCISGAHNQQVRSEKYSDTSSNQVLCKPNFSGLLPYSKDCTKFVNCANGQAYIQDCGPGTVFNPVIQACDHPRNTKCSSDSENKATVSYSLTDQNVRGGRGHMGSNQQSHYEQHITNKNVQTGINKETLYQSATSSFPTYLPNQGYAGQTYNHQTSHSNPHAQTQLGGITKNIQTQNCAPNCQHTGSSSLGHQTHQFGYKEGTYQSGIQFQGGVQQGLSQNCGTNCQNAGATLTGQQPHQTKPTLNCDPRCQAPFNQQGFDSKLTLNCDPNCIYRPTTPTQHFQTTNYGYNTQGAATGQGRDLNVPQNCAPNCQNTAASDTLRPIYQTNQGSQHKIPVLPQDNTRNYNCGPNCQNADPTKNIQQGSQVVNTYGDQTGRQYPGGVFPTVVPQTGTQLKHPYMPGHYIIDYRQTQTGQTPQITQGTWNSASTNYGQNQGGIIKPANSLYISNPNTRADPHNIGGESQINHGRQGGVSDHISGQTSRTDSGSEAIIKCSTGSSGLQPHPYIREKYLNCVNGVTSIVDCSPGTVFNPDLKICDWPYNVKYTTSKQNTLQNASQNPTTQQSDSKTRTGHVLVQFPRTDRGSAQTQAPIKCPSGYSGLLPHPYICAKFLNCANGATYIQDCGPGTVFNPVLKVCDWPYNVKCPTPNTNTGQIRSTGRTAHETQTRNITHSHNIRQTGQTFYHNNGQTYNHTRTSGHSQIGNVGQTGTKINQESQGKTIENKNPSQNHGYNYETHSQSQTAFQNPNLQEQHFATTEQTNIFESNKKPIYTQNYGYGKEYAPNTYTHHGIIQENTQLPNYKPIYTDQQTLQSQQVLQNAQSQNHVSTFQQQPSTIEYIKKITNITSGSNTDQHTATISASTVNGNISTINVQGTKNHIGTKHWPPPFPSTDTSADYYFGEKKMTNYTEKSNRNCLDTEFQCLPGECLPFMWVCDGDKDCRNGLDEINCTRFIDEFVKTENAELDIFDVETWFLTNIQECSMKCVNAKEFVCKSFKFKEDGSICGLSDTNVGLSGALIASNEFSYYERISQSINCTNMYKCFNDKCINYTQVCNGVDDCGNRMDEKSCSAVSLGYEIKLAGSQMKNEGRIEIKVFDEWGYICDDQFDMDDADVACKELGFPLGALDVKSSSYFALGIKDNETYYLMDKLACTGNESSLRDCDFKGWGVHSCMPQEIAGIVCATPQEACPRDHWLCDTSKECIPIRFVCDGISDCNDHSDEGSQHCEAPVELRLVNGTAKHEGRAEIRYRGIWGTICDDDFNDQAAKVICQTMGYYGTAIAKKEGAFGPGNGPIWLDQVNCRGNETSIENCNHWSWGEHNCEHNEDVGVVCGSLDTSQFEKKSKNNNSLQMELIKSILPNSDLPIDCGHRSDDLFFNEDSNGDIHFRVVQGSVATKGHYPWQATVRVKNTIQSSHWCGAVIISNKYILTAAHCLVGHPKGSYFVRAGDYDIDVAEGSEEECYIEDYYIHEQFRQGGHMNNDIALIKLKGAGFHLSTHIIPICLPDQNASYRHGGNCTISGFGSTESGKSTSSRVLRAGWISIQSEHVCKNPQVYGDSMTNGMICAGSLDEGVDSCDGDSGGPLACLDNGAFTLYGLTSWGQRCGHANKPGVYVKVSHYRDWIDKTIKESS